MWFLLAQVLAGAIGSVMDWILPHNASLAAHSAWSALPAPVLGAVTSAIAIFGLFCDLPVFFWCVAFVVQFRCLILVLKVWRFLLELVPMAG
jgi:hypothetical protein